MIHINSNENYVYKKEVDWSLLHEGLTLPIANQVVFAQNMGRFLKRGESKSITFILNGRNYKAKVVNVNYDFKFNRKNDTFQIRYSRNGDLAKAFQNIFSSSYNYIKTKRENRSNSDRSYIRLPEESKEYLAMYTTEYEDTFIIEPIYADEIYLYNNMLAREDMRLAEDILNFEEVDIKSTIVTDERLVRIRKLNRKIGDNLKLLYEYRCQICGDFIGDRYDAHVAEAHHIEYFSESLNNDAENLLILCPNHHRVIHNRNPIFDRKKTIYLYPNGYKEGLTINKHL